MRMEIRMKSGHRPFAKTGQTSEDIDIEELFDRYWTSDAHKFIVLSQSCSLASLLISDREGQRMLLFESIVGL